MLIQPRSILAPAIAVTMLLVVSQGSRAVDVLTPTDFKADKQYFDPAYFEELPAESFSLPEASLPSTRSQFQGATCTAFCTGVLIQFRHCKEQERLTDCKALEAGGRGVVSPLFLRSLSSPSPKQDDWGLPQYLQLPLHKSHPTTWDFEHFNLQGRKNFLPDSCFPYDQLMRHPDLGPDEAGLQRFFEGLEVLFRSVKLQYGELEISEAAVEACKDCAEIRRRIGRTFPLVPNDETIRKALHARSFEQFLHVAMFGVRNPARDEARRERCASIRLREPAYLRPFPGSLDHKTTSKRQVLQEAISQLGRRKEPIRMDNICMQRRASDNSCGGHCMVITGYKTVQSRTNPGHRKILIRVFNSWGAGWQQAHNDGWIDSDKLLSNLNDDDMPVPRVGDPAPSSQPRTRADKKPDEKGVPTAILSWLL
jgi:hypothetical protein